MTHTALLTLCFILCLWCLFLFPVWELADGRWVVRWRCSPALTLGKRLSECGMNLIVKSEIHAANGDFDWLLFLTHVMTLSHSKDVFSPKFSEMLCLLGLTIWHINSFEIEYGSILPLPPSTKTRPQKLLWQDDQKAEFISEQLSYLFKFVPLTFIMSFVWYMLVYGQQTLCKCFLRDEMTLQI